MQLNAEQARVIGSLIEKQLTTPQQYPLSLNATVTACNQTSNRDPVVSYEDWMVEATLAELKAMGLVRFVHPSHGRSVTRYRQVLEEHLDLDRESLALLGVLLLRGPQTPGELRSRTERAAAISPGAALDSLLDEMAARDEPLVTCLGRKPGQKEARWAAAIAPYDPDRLSDTAARERSGHNATQEISALREEVDLLRSEVAALREAMGETTRRLDALSTELGIEASGGASPTGVPRHFDQ